MEQQDKQDQQQSTKKVRAARGKPYSRSKRAGIMFPVGRVARQMHSTTPLRISGIAPVLVAAASQAVLDLLIDATFAQAKAARKDTTRLNERDCMLALSLERNLASIVGPHCVPRAGFVPNKMMQVRITKKSSSQKTDAAADASAE